MTLQNHCPACGAETNHLRLWSKNGCQILKCGDCGLGSAVAHGFDPSSYYTEAYFDGTLTDGYADYVGSEPVIRNEFRRIVSNLRRRIPAGKLFEIGAAYGFFLREAKPYYEVHGIEIAEKAAAFARLGGLDVQSGPVTKDAFEIIGPVDVIVMLDVIEHLEKPDLALQLCSEYLKPGGVLLVTTGDFGSLFAQISGKSWRLMTPPQHLWYFTERSLSQMARRFGLLTEQFEHPWKQVPLSLVIFQLARMTGIKLPLYRLSLLSRVGLPSNLFDALRVTFRKPRNQASAVSAQREHCGAVHNVEQIHRRPKKNIPRAEAKLRRDINVDGPLARFRPFCAVLAFSVLDSRDACPYPVVGAPVDTRGCGAKPCRPPANMHPPADRYIATIGTALFSDCEG